MEIMTTLITFIYYILVASISVILIVNTIKSKDWKKDILYIIVLIPFLLRLFRLK